ncbi:MAG: hypothetical protein GX587_04570, partial [Bacteroidales bacterium]|nr:hypothetical protein [Bacteroidales bacterium]
MNKNLLIIKSTLLILFLFIPNLNNLHAQDLINQLNQNSQVVLDNLEAIPGNEGLAGCYAGLHNNAYILAGGTAFPDKKPWEDGEKYFSNAILVFEKNNEGKFKLIDTSQLPTGIGEGASVSVPGGVLCIGGLTPEGLSASIFLLSWENGQTEKKDFP